MRENEKLSHSPLKNMPISIFLIWAKRIDIPPFLLLSGLNGVKYYELEKITGLLHRRLDKANKEREIRE
jgi:hypothetical protein